MSDSPVSNGKERDNIWITSKVRMNSEKRYKLYALVFHLLITYLAFVMIVTSIFGEALSTHLPYFRQINIAIAVALFAISLIVYACRFTESAQAHRDCYLRLQRLLSANLNSTKLIEGYHEILAGYPNHSSRDMDDLVFERTFMTGKQLRNSEETIRWTYPMLVRKLARFVLFWGSVLSGVFLPILLFAAAWLRA